MINYMIKASYFFLLQFYIFYCHDIAEILLKLVLNTKQSINPYILPVSNENFIVLNDVIFSSSQEQHRNRETAAGASGGAGGGQSSKPRENQSRGSSSDDREGVIKHPRKGKIPTYIFQVMLT
jgi:hypothetical protein